MKPRYATRIRDLLEYKAKLIGVCWGCRREAEVDVLALAARYGELEQVRWLEPKFRCRRCKGQGMMRIDW